VRERGRWAEIQNLTNEPIEILYCTYLEQQQTEKIATEVRDVDRIRITERVCLLSRVAFLGGGGGGQKSAPVRKKQMPDWFSELYVVFLG
jgi:hypothetical protein